MPFGLSDSLLFAGVLGATTATYTYLQFPTKECLQQQQHPHQHRHLQGKCKFEWPRASCAMPVLVLACFVILTLIHGQRAVHPPACLYMPLNL
jgi:hypothetical protein